uniref:30S ribosomal protein S1-like n=1 Tax=Erigeron canadensis TaxID=72917 RepID=UPI001CB8AC3A|nr:30S ribosomal protein S1-like [Erigeron canadensis]
MKEIQRNPMCEELYEHEEIILRSADWKAARAHLDYGIVYQGRVEGSNGGGLLIRFYSLVGFLPCPLLSPSHSCKEPDKPIQEIAKALAGSLISVKVIHAEEEKRKLIFSEKEAAWSKYSNFVKIGNIYQAKVGSVEDYGAFAHLQFPDVSYHLTGLVHVSEVSWDLVQDVRDILNEGEDVKVKVIGVDRNKSRITLSIKQLEEDPLLETLEKVIPQDDSSNSSSDGTTDYVIEPLSGLETILEELLREEGIIDVKVTRQGFEKRVVSQDLQLCLSNAPPNGNQFTLLARAGRQAQEIQLVTSLDQDGIKTALQRLLERVP